jgi:hypothetical protein
MKKTALWLSVLVLTLCGCRQSVSLNNGRLEMTEAGVSVEIPAKWKVSRLAGILFPVISTDKDYGLEPNLFVDYVEEGSDVQTQYDRILVQRAGQYKGYTPEEAEPFVTESGLEGVRSIVKKNMQSGLPMTHVHYVIQAGDKTIAVTATCSEAVSEKYISDFDAIMKSVRVLE